MNEILKSYFFKAKHSRRRIGPGNWQKYIGVINRFLKATNCSLRIVFGMNFLLYSILLCSESTLLSLCKSRSTCTYFKTVPILIKLDL
jgi:hypothetical protein